jgi:hypothetical protein
MKLKEKGLELSPTYSCQISTSPVAARFGFICAAFFRLSTKSIFSLSFSSSQACVTVSYKWARAGFKHDAKRAMGIETRES